MGVVYRALDTATGQRVALKILHGHEAGQKDRFAREAALLAELRHPRIVGYVAHGATDTGQAFIAMEWVDGETLRERLARGPLSVGEAVWMMEAVVDGLAAAHDHGVIHRDLKPANLMLEGGALDRIKILDFGIAHARRAEKLTATGEMLGTPGYMAPEQARGEGPVDVRTDIYALGCVLFRSLAGRAPFDAPDPLAVLLKVTTETAPRLAAFRADVPAALDGLCASMLAKEPSQRPATAREVLERMRGAQNAPTVTAGAFTPSATAAAGGRPWAFVGLACGAALVGALCAAAWFATHGAATGDAADTDDEDESPKKNKRASKTRSDPVPPAPAPAPPPPPKACDALKCEAFAFPNPADIEPLDALPVAIAMAKTIDPNPLLWRIDVGRVDAGVADVRSLEFAFRVRPQNARPGDDAPRYLEIEYQAGRFEAEYSGPEPHARASKPPTCKLKDAWKAAVASGLAANAIASVDYADDANPSLGGVWSFYVANHTEMHRYVDGQTCQVVKKGF